MSPTKGEGRPAKRWHYSISLFSKMGDKGEGRGQKSQKMGDVNYGWPLINNNSTIIFDGKLIQNWIYLWSKTCHDIKNEISLSMFWSFFTLEDFFWKICTAKQILYFIENRFCIFYSFGLIKQYYYLSSFQSNSFNEMFLLNKDTLLYLLILIWNFWCTFSITEVNDLALHSKWQTTLLFNSWFYHHS